MGWQRGAVFKIRTSYKTTTYYNKIFMQKLTIKKELLHLRKLQIELRMNK